MTDLLRTIEAWSADGFGASRAVVIRTFGSSPRREGATMLRSDDGRIAGSVSGGCIEGATAERMEEAAGAGLQRVVRFGVSDQEAWDVGLACGGTIDVLVQPAIPDAVMQALRETEHDRSAGRVIVTVLPEGSPGGRIGASEQGPASRPGAPLVVHEDGRLDGSLGDPIADGALVDRSLAALASGTSSVIELGGQQLFIETYAVRPRLFVVGAV